MKIINSLYCVLEQTLTQNPKAYPIENKISKHQSNYFLFHLNNVEKSALSIHKTPVFIQEHHLSIFKFYSTHQGRDYFYHYTANCHMDDPQNTFTVHVYFNKNNQMVGLPEFSTQQENVKSWIHCLTERDKQGFYSLARHHAVTNLSPFQLDLAKFAKTAELDYQRAKKNLEDSCYNHVVSIQDNLALLEIAEEQVNLLAAYSERSFHKTFVSLQQLKLALQNALSKQSKSETIKNTQHIPDLETKENESSERTTIEPLQTLSQPNLLDEEKILQKIAHMQNLHTNIEQLVHQANLKFESDEIRCQTALNLHTQLAELFTETDELFQLPNALDYITPELRIQFFMTPQQFWQFSENFTLKSLERFLLNNQFDLAKQFIGFLSLLSDQLITILLKNDNLNVLQFIASHDPSRLTDRTITLKHMNTAVPLFVAAWHLNSPNCFSFLLNYQTDLLAPDSSGLPYIHPILTSNQSNAFYAAMVDHITEHQKYFVFLQLKQIIRTHLDSEQLSPEDQESCENALLFYDMDSKNPHLNAIEAKQSLKLSRQLKHISEPWREELQNWLNLPSTKQKIKILQEEGNRVIQLLKKMRLNSKAFTIVSKQLAAIEQFKLSKDEVTPMLVEEGFNQSLRGTQLTYQYLCLAQKIKTVSVTQKHSRRSGKWLKMSKEAEKIYNELKAIYPDVDALLEEHQQSQEIMNLIKHGIDTKKLLADFMSILLHSDYDEYPSMVPELFDLMYREIDRNQPTEVGTEDIFDGIDISNLDFLETANTAEDNERVAASHMH